MTSALYPFISCILPPFINFTYDDSDSWLKEIAEFYGYEECNDFNLNTRVFQSVLLSFRSAPVWTILKDNKRLMIISDILGHLELTCSDKRRFALRFILYLLQGCYGEVDTPSEIERMTHNNAKILYQLDAFPLLVKIFKYEYSKVDTFPNEKKAFNIYSNMQLISAIIYTIIESFRFRKQRMPNKLSDEFIELLRSPFDGELFIVTLFNILDNYSINSTDLNEFPIDKIILLLWKTSLLTLGGMNELRKLKLKLREKYNLPRERNEDIIRIKKGIPDIKKIVPKLYTEKVYHYKRPKVSKTQLISFINAKRLKYYGYVLANDIKTDYGLPIPIKTAIETFKNYRYTNLADIQIENNEKFSRNPLIFKETIKMTPTEYLYQAIYDKLDIYVISLLNLLSKAVKENGTDSVHVQTFLQFPKWSEINKLRRNEIIAKASSAILLLYLKHLKLNHIYQFEHLSSYLINGKCISIFNEFLVKSLKKYSNDNFSVISKMEFPYCQMHRRKPLLKYIIRSEYNYSWRNIFTCINFLRILNKIVKGKNDRILQLFYQNSWNFLKKLLYINNPIVHLYTLKLVKMQVKYYGRKWIRGNTKIINLIYKKVRHRFNDDWAVSFNWNDQDSLQLLLMSDEKLLLSIKKFHQRRYSKFKNDYDGVEYTQNYDINEFHKLLETFEKSLSLDTARTLRNSSDAENSEDTDDTER